MVLSFFLCFFFVLSRSLFISSFHSCASFLFCTGKKANPPRYWKSAVFPSALAFIAATTGGITSNREQILSSPACRDDDEIAAACAGGCEKLTGDEQQQRPQQQNVLAVLATESRCSGEAEAMSPSVGGETVAGGVGGGDSRSDGVGHHLLIPSSSSSSSLPQQHQRPRQSLMKSPPKRELLLLQQAHNIHLGYERVPRPSSHHRQKQQQHLRKTPEVSTYHRGQQQQATPAKCLIVCPTGAEASIVVCLAALLTFFPFPPDRSNETARGNNLEKCKRPQEMEMFGHDAVVDAATTAESGASSENSHVLMGGGDPPATSEDDKRCPRSCSYGSSRDSTTGWQGMYFVQSRTPSK